MATRKKAKPKVYPRLFFRCGYATANSIAKAFKDKKKKSVGALLRMIIEEWLQLNGYPVDEA